MMDGTDLALMLFKLDRLSTHPFGCHFSPQSDRNGANERQRTTNRQRQVSENERKQRLEAKKTKNSEISLLHDTITFLLMNALCSGFRDRMYI